MAQQLETPDDVYRTLGRQIGGEPDVVVWHLLLDDRWPEDVISGEASMEELKAKYDRMLATLREGGRKARPALATKPPRLETGPWSTTLSEIMALEAAGEPYVLAFRKHVLNDQLLSPEEAERWLLEKATLAEEFRVFPRPDMPGAGVGPRENPWESQLAVEDYVHGKAPERATRADHELDFLYCLADVLQGWYGWSEGTSVHRFILSSETPKLHALRAYFRPRQRLNPGSSTIVLLVNSHCSPRQVMAFYSEARQSFLPDRQRVRPPDAQDLALALFLARANDGSTWNVAMQSWNNLHPDHRYDEVRSFSRDARKAYHRVVGNELEWQGGRQTKRRTR